MSVSGNAHGQPVVIEILPVNDAKDRIAALEARPGPYNNRSSGNGTVLHPAAEMILDQDEQAKLVKTAGVKVG